MPPESSRAAKSNKSVSLSDLMDALKEILGRPPTFQEKRAALQVAAMSQRAGEEYETTMESIRKVMSA